MAFVDKNKIKKFGWLGVAVKINRWFLALVVEGFDDFAHDKSFKKLPALGSVLNGFRRQPFGQVGHLV